MCSAPVALGLSAAAAELEELLQPSVMCPQLQHLPFSSLLYGGSTVSRGSSFIDMGELDTGCSLGGQDQFLFPDDTPTSQATQDQGCCLMQMLELQLNAPRQLHRPSLGSGSCESMFQPDSSACYEDIRGDDSSCEDDARCFDQALLQLSQLGCGGDFNPSESPSPPASSNGQHALTTFTWDSAMTNAFVPRAPVLPSGPGFETASSSRSISPALPYQSDSAPSLLIPLDALDSTSDLASHPYAIPSCLLQPDIKPQLKRASWLLQPLAAAQTMLSAGDNIIPLHQPLVHTSSNLSEEAILSSSSDLWHQPLLPILSDASNTTLVSLAALDDDSLTTQHLNSFQSASSSDLQSAAEAAAADLEEITALTKPSPHQHKNGGPCDHCGTSESPQWRRGPSNKPTLCNACGTRFRRTNQLGPAGLNAGNRAGSGTQRISTQAATTAEARARKDSASAAAAARELAAITPVAVLKERDVLPAKRIPKRSSHLVADAEANTVQEERAKRQRVPPRHK